jgi:hypothetical protein
MLNPCSDQSCEWIQGETSYNASAGTGGWLKMTGRRWYPMVEVLEDGSLIVIGADLWGGYVNMASQDNPTYEYFPPKGDGLAINLQFLTDCLPTNLYALTWLMPSGRLFMQANLKTILLNHTDTTTINLPDTICDPGLSGFSGYGDASTDPGQQLRGDPSVLWRIRRDSVGSRRLTGLQHYRRSRRQHLCPHQSGI